MMPRNLLISALLLLAALTAFSQNTRGFNYQAVARDGSGSILANTAVNLRFKLVAGPLPGTIVYQETHAPTTNAFGLINVAIGKGTVAAGNFESIDWASGVHFLIVELNNISLDTTEFEAVPYSKVATAMELSDLVDVSGLATNGEILKWDGSAWVPMIDETDDGDTDSTNELQSLSLNGNSLSLSNGNSITIPVSVWNTIGNDIYYDAGNVGIGTDSPAYPLHVGSGKDVVWGDYLSTSGPKLYYNASQAAIQLGFLLPNTAVNDSMGLYSFAQGFESIAPGLYAVALNSRSRSHADLSFTAGLNNYSDTYLQYTLGRYASRYSGSPSNWVATNPLFVVGNGNSENNRNNAFTIQKNGLIGINEAAPTYLLDIENDDLSSRTIYVKQAVNAPSTGTAHVGIYVDLDKFSGTTAATGIETRTVNLGGTSYGLLSSGTSLSTGVAASYGIRSSSRNDNGSGASYGIYSTVSFGSSSGARYAGYFAGDVFSVGSYLPSDKRLKKEIEPSRSVLSKLLQLPIMTYTYQRDRYPDMNLPRGIRTGFMAQDVAQLMPELVAKATQPAATPEEQEMGATQTEDIHFQAVDYAGMVPYLVKAMQEQQEQIEQQQLQMQQQLQQIQAQQSQMDQQQAQLEALIAEVKALQQN